MPLGVCSSVDSPGLVRPPSVSTAELHTVYRIFSGKYRLSPGLHIGMGMGEDARLPMLVIRIQGKVSVGAILLRGRYNRPEPFVKAMGGYVDAASPKGIS